GEVDTAPSKEEEGLEFDDIVFEVDPEVILREVRSCGDILTDEAITWITVAFSKDLDAEDTQEVSEEEVLLEEGHVPPLGGKVKQKRLPIVYKSKDAMFLSSKRTFQQLYDTRRVMSEPLGKLNVVTFNNDQAWVVCGLGTKFSSGKAPEGSLLAIAMPGNSLKPHLITNLNHSAKEMDDKLKAKIENLHKINDTLRDKRKNALSQAISSLWDMEQFKEGKGLTAKVLNKMRRQILLQILFAYQYVFVDLTDAREKAKAEMADGKYKGKPEKDVMREKEEKRHRIFQNVAKRSRNASRYRKYGPPLHQTPGPQTPATKKRKKSENRKAKQSRRASRRKQEKADENQATVNEAAPTMKATAPAKKTPRKKAATKKPTVNGAVAETTTNETTTKKITANEITANETTTKKTTTKKTTANETTANETTANETTANETTAKKPPAKKTTPNETAANETTAKKAPAKEKTEKRINGLPI
ncbi:hypothetical protein HDU96_002257, partial [Phlyctochytrium bullatum]